MTTAEIERNYWAREAALLRRIARQERFETFMFRVVLVALAVGGTALIIWRNIDGGWGAIGTDVVLVGMYMTAIWVTWRNDARS